MNRCKLGVNLNGTTSLEAKTGAWLDVDGSSSLIAIWPVVRDRWNREGSRLVKQRIYVMKHVAAS